MIWAKERRWHVGYNKKRRKEKREDGNIRKKTGKYLFLSVFSIPPHIYPWNVYLMFDTSDFALQKLCESVPLLLAKYVKL